MTWIKTIDEPDAAGEVGELYAAMLDPESGRVDNILKIHSLHPAGLRAHFDLYRAVMRSTPTTPSSIGPQQGVVVTWA